MSTQIEKMKLSLNQNGFKLIVWLQLQCILSVCNDIRSNGQGEDMVSDGK